LFDEAADIMLRIETGKMCLKVTLRGFGGSHADGKNEVAIYLKRKWIDQFRAPVV
jgi:hypothetical protein